MDLNTAEAMAISMMKEYGLDKKGWTFAFDRAKKRLGLCNFTKKQITISHYMTSASDAEVVRQTMLHEIAHALLPPYVKHGKAWKNLSKSIGYTGERTSDNPYVDQERERAKREGVDPDASNKGLVIVLEKNNPSKDVRSGDVVKANGKIFTIGERRRTRYNATCSDGRKYSIHPDSLRAEFVIMN